MEERTEWMTISEAAEDRGVHWVSIRQAIERGAIKARVGYRKGVGPIFVVLRADVERYKRGRQGRLSRRKERVSDTG